MRRLLGTSSAEGTVQLLEAALVIGTEPDSIRMMAVIDATSFDTGSPKRDAEVRSAKFLDTATFPEFVFSCRFVEHHDGKWVAVGELTAHGVTAPVDVVLDQFNDTLSGDLALHARATIDRYAHGMSAGRGLVGRHVRVTIAALATRARHASGPRWSEVPSYADR